MRRRQALFLILSVFLLISYSQLRGRGLFTSDGLPDPDRIDRRGLAGIPPVSKAIETFQERIRQDSGDGVSYTLLGEAYIRQARETGDLSAYQRAETALSRALEILPGYAPAGSLLATVYYSQHDFTRALSLAESVYQSNPKNSQARVIAADCHLALGNYEEAERIYAELAEVNSDPPLLARLANLAELEGKPDEAITLIRRAAAQALASGGTQENAAWYLLRVGDLYFNRGDIRQSGAYYEASLRVFDDYHLALAGLARVRAAEGRYEDAITLYERATAIIPQPEFLAALGDLYLLTGQPDKAEKAYETVEYIGKLAALNQQVYNRQLANFYSDHDRKVDEALRLALAELDARQDVYGYDAAAWAYYRNGDLEHAQSMMDRALALGTRDARLYFHGGMIAYARLDRARARTLLEEALAINPHFSPIFAAEARDALASLQTTSSK